MLSVSGKVYGKILAERLMYASERMVSEEHRGFRKGKGYVDQILIVKL